MKTKKSKCCTNPPVVFSQPAINLLHDWFPDSNGNLDAEEVWDALEGHYGMRGENIYPDVPEGSPAHEVLTKVEPILQAGGGLAFSPVLG